MPRNASGTGPAKTNIAVESQSFTSSVKTDDGETGSTPLRPQI